MNTVTVKASRRYDIYIGNNILPMLPSVISQLKYVKKVCIVSDNNVFPLYGRTVSNILSENGYEVSSFVFPSGESSKNADTYISLLRHLASLQLTRTDLIIALGGGVVGDLAGSAAATYLRGIRFAQLPTTLLAAVDSSVGGKTAIDLPEGKNLAGAFYQPDFVICDTALLETLPGDYFIDGCAEVIKYAVLYDPLLFSHLEENGLRFSREDVITRCIQWKRDVVEADEFDQGLRKKLNLGHTIGHAIEKQSGFTVSHGRAVAAGMAIVARAAQQMSLCEGCESHRIISLLKQFGLPVTTCFSSGELFAAACSDKKRSGETLDMIIPYTIGNCYIQKVHVSQLESMIQAGL